MKYIISIFSVLLFFMSCVQKKSTNSSDSVSTEELIRIDFGKEYTKKRFPNTNYAMTIQRLEDNEEYPVGNVDKLIVDAKKIYILDSTKAKALFIYDRNGRLLHVINQTGKGPGSFFAPQDFEIDRKTGNIIIMDTNLRKFVVYSPEGKYIKEFGYDFYAVHFALDNENNILADNGNIPSEDSAYRLKNMDLDGKFLNSFFASDPSTTGITFNPRAPLQQCDGKMYYLPTLSNNIYTLEGTEAAAAYQLDFGKYWPSKEFCESVKGMHPLKIRELMFKNNYVCFLNYIQTKSVLHLDFYMGKKYSFYYDKNTKKSLLISMEDESLSFPLATYGDEFIFVKYHEDTGAPTIVFYTVNFDL
jgi:hypothetical protein